jgi:subtilisin-like proprotein convertase family protein
MFTLFKESHVNAEIPDHSGISNSINVWREGIVKDLKVHLDIAHPFIGDLIVKLASPSGQEVVLHNREGGAADDLNTIVNGEILNQFHGTQAKGLWTLTVEDHATRDTGILNFWGLDLDCDEFEHYKTEIFIPETGEQDTLVSTQECRFTGRITSAEAELEIEHPLIGDLVVSMFSPSGTEIILHNREGGSQNHLLRHFDNEHMKAFVGDETAGTWTLKIKNFHSANNGVLKHWKIKFAYEAVDDLKVVEGIGPKIEQLLNNAGIWSFAGLAVTPADHIKSILTAAGDRFKMHEPGTWPQQASLAAQGKWDELKAWQDAMTAGRAETVA